MNLVPNNHDPLQWDAVLHTSALDVRGIKGFVYPWCFILIEVNLLNVLFLQEVPKPSAMEMDRQTSPDLPQKAIQTFLFMLGTEFYPNQAFHKFSTVQTVRILSRLRLSNEDWKSFSSMNWTYPHLDCLN